jgi:hypothetical protein
MEGVDPPTGAYLESRKGPPCARRAYRLDKNFLLHKIPLHRLSWEAEGRFEAGRAHHRTFVLQAVTEVGLAGSSLLHTGTTNNLNPRLSGE